uniref:GNAT family N-acetyltransferase n=1 Tax=Altererythrobacter segetis TaxID=1104773 RepID=UPI001407295D|nr:GNAT family N-acetyltransferase [Altererythrobacter segetis]
MAEVILTTPRLNLRLWEERDLDNWLTHLNTPEVKAYLGGIETPDKVAEKFAKLNRDWHEDGYSFLAVEMREDAMFLGTCGIAAIATECAPDGLKGGIQVGWQLRADRWGHGYATEAAAAVVAMAFDRFDRPTLYAQTSERNRGSWRVMERLGMQRRSELDYDDPDYPDEDNPTMVWSITREAWQDAHA